MLKSFSQWLIDWRIRRGLDRPTMWNNKCPTNLHSRFSVNHSLSQCSTLMKPIFLIVKSSYSYFNDHKYQYRVWMYQLVNFAQGGTFKGLSVMVEKLFWPRRTSARFDDCSRSGSNVQCIVKSSRTFSKADKVWVKHKIVREVQM